MTIGEVAKQAGVRASAIRFYEQAGLLPKPARASGQRRYDENALDRLAVLEYAKACGFTLAECRQLFHGFSDNAPMSRRVQGIAAKKIAELDALTHRIRVMKEVLESAQRCRCIDLQECGRKIRHSRGVRRPN
jgi:MerR family redox-sensitive transcriptional activator SoxR